MCMHVCACVIWLYMYACMFVCHMCTWMCVFMCVCTCLSMCIHAHMCLHRCMCVHMFMCVLLYEYMHMSVHVNANLIHIPILHSFIYKPLSQHPEYQEIKLLAFSSSLPSWAPILWQLSFLGAPPSQVLSPLSFSSDATREHFPSNLLHHLNSEFLQLWPQHPSVAISPTPESLFLGGTDSWKYFFSTWLYRTQPIDSHQLLCIKPAQLVCE